MSQKSPMGLTRQGTMRSSHKRKNSISTPLNLQQGRRSPSIFQDQKSPQGRKSPILLVHEPSRSPGFSAYMERRSPTSAQGRRSPHGFYQGFDPDRRSPTSFLEQDKKSPMGLGPFEQGRRSPTIHVQGRNTNERRQSTVQVQGRRSPIGYSQGLITSITISPMENRSPVGTVIIPPITVSNPSETCAIISKSLEFNADQTREVSSSKESTLQKDASPLKEPPQERKEKPSVMREILAFVRKPSKKVASTTRTGRFAAAFSRAESGSSTPLLRQSTFSASPAASSHKNKSAVTKQMSEVGFEPKISLKFTKMSLRLRRSDEKKKDKKSSGDEISESENESIFNESSSKVGSRSSSIVPFELENVRFEKVGESYIKHEQITEESIENTSPIKIVALSDKIAQKENESVDIITPEVITEQDSNSDLLELKKSLEHIINSNLDEIVVIDEEKKTDTIVMSTVQCPTFEIEPPSRRASFDPPRSPYLESLRSPIDNEHDLLKHDSGGESFEIIDTDKNRESSFEDRYSSRDTSFDISRYQSTSYEDQNSSFELVEIELNQRCSIDEKKSTFDLRKSSIELVDVETFQRTRPEGRKSSLETHFDYTKPRKPELTTQKSAFGVPRTKRQVSEPSRCRDHCSSNMKSHYSAPQRARSPLSTQTSSNFSSRDSYDSSFEPISIPRPELKSPYADPSKQHFPYPRKLSNDNQSFLCTDQRCANIFEPRPSRISSPLLGGNNSGNEFEPPSPRRAVSTSPKHTFTFRIVMKKVDSSPDALWPCAERRNRQRRRDSRKKKLKDADFLLYY